MALVGDAKSGHGYALLLYIFAVNQTETSDADGVWSVRH